MEGGGNAHTIGVENRKVIVRRGCEGEGRARASTLRGWSVAEEAHKPHL